MILGIGSDLTDIRRITQSLEKYEDRFENRVFAEIEQTRARAQQSPAAAYAKRFAAKEAFVKSLGTGFAHNINFKDINVSKKRSGKPYLTLSNKLKNILKRKLKLKKVKIFLSLSDEREYSVAYVITQKIK